MDFLISVMRTGFMLLFVGLLCGMILRAQSDFLPNSDAVSLLPVSDTLTRLGDFPVAKKKILYFRAGVSLFFPKQQNTSVLIFPAFTLVPGLRLVQEKNFIMSLNCPISVGATSKSDLFLGLDLPFMIDFNIGSAAGNDKKAGFGFLLGAGMAYTNVVNNYSEESGEYVHAEYWGYRFQFGIDIGKMSEAVGEITDRVLIVFSYGRAVETSRSSNFGISLQFMFGN